MKYCEVCVWTLFLVLSYKACGYSMNKIVNMFGENTMSNDNKVFTFINQHFDISPKRLSNVNNQLNEKLVKSNDDL